MRRRINALVTFLAALAVAGLVSVPTTASASESPTYPVRSFNLSNGGLSAFGDVTFYNRTVVVQGSVSSYEMHLWGCGYVKVSWNGRTGWSTQACNGSTGFSIPLDADVPGGAGYVDVALFVNTGISSYAVAQRRIYR
jgi:hypothetical protein